MKIERSEVMNPLLNKTMVMVEKDDLNELERQLEGFKDQYKINGKLVEKNDKLTDQRDKLQGLVRQMMEEDRQNLVEAGLSLDGWNQRQKLIDSIVGGAG